MIDDTRFVARSNLEGLIKSWLDPPDPSTNHIQARKEHHQDTGLWFLTSERYKQWKARLCNTLWLHGIPGCGKTILSSTVIENLKTSCEASNDVLLYFYFNFNDSKKQSFNSLVRSLVFQLYHIQQKSRSSLEQLYSSCKDGREQPQHGQLLTTLHIMLHNAGTTYIILDALDECRTRKELQSWLAKPEVQGLQLFLTSRREQDIECSISSWLAAASIVPIRQGPVDNDILAFIHSNVAEDKELQRWQYMPDVCIEIERKLMEKAGGM
jgi:Cdc6-like AAA superfamily ATPase